MTRPYLEIIEKVKQSEVEDVLILPHKRADGDAIAASLGLWAILKNMAKRPQIVLSEKLPFYLEPFAKSLVNLDQIVVYPDYKDWLKPQEHIAFLLDCHAKDRLADRGELFDSAREVYCFDHHLSEEDLPLNFWVDPKRASTADMVAELALALAGSSDLGSPLEFGPDLATALLMGIYSDTGGLRYSSTSPELYSIAGNLRARGAKLELINQALFANRRLSAQRILGLALTNFKQDQSGRIAWYYVDYKTRLKLGLEAEDFEGLANELLATSGVEIAFLARQLTNKSIQISLRAKPPRNVQKIAREFGGGGHLQAAGVTVSRPQLKELFPELMGSKELIYIEALLAKIVKLAQLELGLM